MIVIDQLDRQIDLKHKPRCIVSLVPSHTELLIDLGLSKYLTGRTKFCIHPKRVISGIEVIGGTKNLRHDRINEIMPDLIIANKEENNEEDVRQLEKQFPVWVSDIKTLEDSFQMIKSVSEIFNVSMKALDIINQSHTKLESLKSKTIEKAVYLIWRKPYMTVGSDTYIHHIMDYLGFDNVYKDHKRYPEITFTDIIHATPDIVLLSSEPYPFNKVHKAELIKAMPETRIELVDGEVFSWYGSRILHKNSILIN